MFGSPPSPPDYTGAAREQAASGRQLTAEQTYANRPDISTPFGSVHWTPPQYDPWFGTGGQPGAGGGQTYTASGGGGGDNPAAGLGRAVGGAVGGLGGMFGGGGGGDRGIADVFGRAVGNDQGGGGAGGGEFGRPPGRWAMDVSLSPEMQAALESQQRIGAARSGLAESMFGRVGQELGQAPDFSNLPEGAGALDQLAPGAARNRAEEALYGRATSRLDPQFQQRQDQLDAQLRAQGINPGSQAYQQQMDNLGREREAAYAGARQESIAGGGAEAQRELGMGLQRGEYAQNRRNSAIAEQLQRRGWSLNEINSLLSGQQIGMPQMPGFSQAGVSAPPNLLGAAQAQYGSALQNYGMNQAQLQGLMSGGFGLGAAAMPFLF